MCMRNGPYILITPPTNYPGKLYRKRYAYQHHVVWWENTGELLNKNEIIHHVNHNKHDNSFDNLQKLTESEHAKLHGALKKRAIIKLNCTFCNGEFEIEVRSFNSKTKMGQENFYCCRSHQVKMQWKQGKKHPRNSSVP